MDEVDFFLRQYFHLIQFQVISLLLIVTIYIILLFYFPPFGPLMDNVKYQDREKLINGYTVYSSRKYSRSFSNDFHRAELANILVQNSRCSQFPV